MYLEKIAKGLKDRSKKIVTEKQLSRDDCILIITQAFQIVEADKNQAHSNLKLFRDWLNHQKLDRNSSILKSIYNEFDQQINVGDFVADLFSTKNLRMSLKQIFSSVGVEFRYLDSYSFWKKFLEFLFDELLHKPIEILKCIELFDKPHVDGKYCLPKKLYLEIATGHEGVDFIKKGDLLFIMKIYECTYEKGNYQEKDALIPLKGKFYMNEFRKDFLYD